MKVPSLSPGAFTNGYAAADLKVPKQPTIIGLKTMRRWKKDNEPRWQKEILDDLRQMKKNYERSRGEIISDLRVANGLPPLDFAVWDPESISTRPRVLVMDEDLKRLREDWEPLLPSDEELPSMNGATNGRVHGPKNELGIPESSSGEESNFVSRRSSRKRKEVEVEVPSSTDEEEEEEEVDGYGDSNERGERAAKRIRSSSGFMARR